MFNNFKEEARKTILVAKSEMSELNHPYVSSEHLLLAILKGKNVVSEKLKKYNVTYDSFKKEVIKIIGVGRKKSEWVLYTPMFKAILEKALMISSNNYEEVGIEHLFEALLDEGEGIAVRILISMGIDIDEVCNEFLPKITKKNHKEVVFLKNMGVDLTEVNNLDPVIGRDKEIKRIIEILTRRTKNNPLLIGEAGVGKTAIVEELSHLISLGEVPPKLLNKKIINIDMSALVAGTKYRGEFEDKINKIIKEVEDNDDIILFIDEIHTLVGAGGAEGAIDAANILKPALARGKLKIIGATTMSEYKKFIEPDKALERRFQTIIVEEPDKETVKKIVSFIKPIYEDYHKVFISDEILNKMVDYSALYLKKRKEPDRTIDILDEVCSHANLKDNKNLKTFNTLNKELASVTHMKKNAILADDYDLAYKLKISEQDLMTKINNLEFKLSSSKKTKVTLNDLEDVLISRIKVPKYILKNNVNLDILYSKLTKDIYGQDKQLKNILNVFKNNINNDSVCGMLFAGGIGVGKNLTASTFANLIGYNVIKLDMKEYSDITSIHKLIGAKGSYSYLGDEGILESVNNYPFTVLILEDIDKCHENVLDLFLTILSTNKIKNEKGDTIYFNNSIIIATSSSVNYNTLGFNTKHSNLENVFSKFFLNKIGNIIEFDSLNKDTILKIIDKKYKHKLRLNSKQKGEIILKCDYKKYGASKIPYIIKDYQNTKLKI